MSEVNLDDAPRKVQEMYDKGFVVIERGNLGYAIDMFLAVLDLEPNLLRARRFLRAAQVKRFKDKGGGQLAHALSSVTGIPGIIAAAMAMKKDPIKAVRTTENLLNVDPLNKTFINLHVQATLAAEMPKAAIMMLEVAREFYPKDMAILKRLASLYMDQNETRKGRECYEVLLNLNPTDPEIIKSYKDATALDTMSKGGWTEAGSYRDVMKDTKEATQLEQQSKAVKTSRDIDMLIEDSLKKIAEEPMNINYRRGLADLYIRAEQLDEAQKTLLEAQELSGGADPQIDRALSNIRLKQFDNAIEALKEAGDDAGVEAKRAERDAFQLKDAEERVQRYPNDLQFRYELGVLLYENNQLNEAIQQFQLAQRNPQRRIRTLYYLGLAFKSKEQYDIALEQLEKAAAELPLMDATKKDILYELGIISEIMGKPEKAAQYFKEIYSVDISYRDIAARIEQSYK